VIGVARIILGLRVQDMNARGEALVTASPSFDRYVAEHTGQLRRFAYLICGNAADAADLVQDALLGLYPRWDKVSADGSPDAYLRRSIVNAHISKWRKNSRYQAVASVDAWADPEPDIAQQVADAAAAVRLVAELPPQQRAAVVLRFYEQLSFAEIGVILGVREASARSLVRYGLKSLQDRLGADHG
jgi:RNA polymerase sigma-70 factor (sigma-E family)